MTLFMSKEDLCVREKQQDLKYGIQFFETIELNSDQLSTEFQI